MCAERELKEPRHPCREGLCTKPLRSSNEFLGKDIPRYPPEKFMELEEEVGR